MPYLALPAASLTLPCPFAQIKETWQRLCKQHHPDLQPAHLRAQSELYFKDISTAYRTLTARASLDV